MKQSYTIKQIINIILKRIKLVILFSLLGLAASAVVTFFFITPNYSSQAQMVVTLPQKENTNSNDVTTNLQMINTYKDFIISDLVLNQVEDRLKSDYGLEMKPEMIKKSIKVEQNQNSQMFSIVAVSNNARKSAFIANTVANIFKENASDVLNIDRITIISSAVVETTPVSPNNKLNLIIGIVLGAISGIFIAILLELMDRTVKDSNFIIEELDFIILGTVPQISDKEMAENIKKAKNISIENLNESTTSGNSEQKISVRRTRARIK